jgi:hypothetical protein
MLSAAFERYRDKTVVASCHRWSLIPMFDTVVQLRNERIVKVDTAQEFLTRASPHPLGPFDSELAPAA